MSTRLRSIELELTPEQQQRLEAIRARGPGRGIQHFGIRPASRVELSPAQRNVLMHMCNGLQNNDIAKVEHISLETVKSHVKHVLAKLNARNRTHAVAVAFRTGLAE